MQLFTIQDKLNRKITIESETIDPVSELFLQRMHTISAGLTRAYTPVELEFSKQFPHYLAQDKFLHSIAPLMREGSDKVQWSQVESEITQILDRFFNHDFQKGFLDNREMSASFTHHLLIAKEGSSPLGALYCMMSKTDNQKVVRVPLFAINPEAQNRGIGRNLMMNILRQIPDCRKIALSTRVSNKKAISAYQHWGFTPVAGTMESWANLEYIVD